MTNLLTFYGSCGHTTVEEVSVEEWDFAAEKNYSIVCEDNLSRMVYVCPSRFFLCCDCAEEEVYSDEFATLRFFFQSPIKGSSKYKPEELIAERKAQTIALGRSMLPSFSEDKILQIASKITST